MEPSSSVIIVEGTSYQSISVPDGSYNIVATVPSGQVFDQWVTTATVEDIYAADTWLTVEGSDVTVTATFTDTPPVTYLVTMEPSSSVIIVEGTSYQSISVPDGSYNIVATVPSGQVFDHWVTTATIADISAADTWLTVAGSDVTVTATFTDPPPVKYLVSLRSVDPSVIRTAIIVDGTPHETVYTVYPGTYSIQTYLMDETFHYIFYGWSVSAGGSITRPDLSSTTVTIPAANTTITALYHPATRIRMETSGAVGASADISYNGVLYTDVVVPEGNYTITAHPPAGYTFSEWQSPPYSVDNTNAATTTLRIPSNPITYGSVYVRAIFTATGSQGSQGSIYRVTTQSSTGEPAIKTYLLSNPNITTFDVYPGTYPLHTYIDTSTSRSVFNGWNITGGGSITRPDLSNTTVTIPAANTTITSLYTHYTGIRMLTRGATGASSADISYNGVPQTEVIVPNGTYTITARPADEDEFSEWQSADYTYSDPNSASTTINITDSVRDNGGFITLTAKFNGKDTPIGGGGGGGGGLPGP